MDSIFWPVFDEWFERQDVALKVKVLVDLRNLEEYGPSLSRPYSDTVNGSRHRNMKELRIQYAGHPVRAFFAFDPVRRAIVLCAGDKSNDKKFYDRMIRIADE